MNKTEKRPNNPVQTLHDNTPVRAEFVVPPTDLPSSARAVIVGGGIAGNSLAYHFAQAGWDNVCLLEQNRLSSGTTWHAAGMVGQLRSSSAQTKVNKASVELYARLKSETGHDPGWLNCGGLQFATCKERLYQLQRTASVASLFGVEAEVISAERCKDYWSMLNTEDLLGGVYLPGDGRVLPGECTIALAKGAIQGGVQIVEGIAVEGFIVKESPSGMKRFCGVKTNRGEITCEWVVLACNMWMRQLGMMEGVDIPVYPCEHHYVITRPMEGVTRNSPGTRDPDVGNYFRALDDGALKLGTFRKRSKPWKIGDHVPGDFAFDLLEPDWPDFAEAFAAHQHRLPFLKRDDVVKFVNGPEAFTPDNNFIMGEPSCTEGLFVCGGWNSAGIACSGGAGKFAVEWMENGGMTLDFSAVDVRRFLPFQNERTYLTERVSEVLGLHYQMVWPGREKETSRDVRASALRPIHESQNACFGQTAGWERPLFYAPEDAEPRLEYSFRRQNWHNWVNKEVHACRNAVALIDQSTFAKFMLEGPDAAKVMQWLCGGDVCRGGGRAVYTGLFNAQGTFESDLTVVQTGGESFYIVTATNQQVRDFDWISQHLENHQATLTDVTEQYCVLSVMGPRAPEVLKKLHGETFSNDAAYGTVKDARIGDADVRALRISYVGEPGWELHVPVAQAVGLHESILAASAVTTPIRSIGTYAVSALRIEKGFRAFGHELSPAETPLEAGLAWAIDWTHPFLGRDALVQKRTEELDKRLACFVLETNEQPPDFDLWGSEPIFWNGEPVGYTTSACYSPTLATNIAMGYVKNPGGGAVRRSDLSNNRFEIAQLGERYAARASVQSPLRM